MNRRKSAGSVLRIPSVVVTVVMGIAIAEITGASWKVLGSVALVLYVAVWLVDRLGTSPWRNRP